MKIERLNYGGLCCNIFVLGEEGGPCLVVDPGSDGGGKLQEYLKKHHSCVEAVLLTHGHFDHIGGIESFDPSIPVFMHDEDVICFSSSRYNVSYPLIGREITFEVPKTFTKSKTKMKLSCLLLLSKLSIPRSTPKDRFAIISRT